MNKFTRGKLENEEIPRPENFSDKTIALAKKILTAQLLEQVRIYAHEDAEKLRPQLKGGNYTHFFARLEGFLTRIDKKICAKIFRRNCKRTSTKAVKCLRNIYIIFAWRTNKHFMTC